MVKVTLSVYRRLDNRSEGLDDQSPRGFELHNLRKKALHDVFDTADAATVTSWGKTDDSTQTHEIVEIVVAAVTPVLTKYVVAPALKYVGEKLAKKAVDKTSQKLVGWIISKLGPKQKKKEVMDYTIEIQGGTSVHVYPSDIGATVTIRFDDGTIERSALRY